MYKPKDETKNWEAPPGVGPWRDLTDEAFDALNAENPGIERWFDHVKDPKKPKGGDS